MPYIRISLERSIKKLIFCVGPLLCSENLLLREINCTYPLLNDTEQMDSLFPEEGTSELQVHVIGLPKTSKASIYPPVTSKLGSPKTCEPVIELRT